MMSGGEIIRRKMMRIDEVVYNKDKTDKMYLYRLDDDEREFTRYKTDYIISYSKLDVTDKDNIEDVLYEIIRQGSVFCIDKSNKDAILIYMKSEMEKRDLVKRFQRLQDDFNAVVQSKDNLLTLFNKISEDHPDILAEYTGISNNTKPYDLS